MKIFVTVGTQKQKFDRLIKYVSDNIDLSNTTFQLGSSKCEKDCNSFKYINDFDQYIMQSDLIITHGGVGTIMKALELNKKVIAVNRLKKYNEHVNDHQEQFCMQMNQEGYIMWAKDEEEFIKCFNKINDFIPKKYISNNIFFNEKLNDLIKELSNE